MDSYIKEFASQQCVGEDWTRDEYYYIGEAVMSDSSQQTVYSVIRWTYDASGHEHAVVLSWATEPPPFWKRRQTARASHHSEKPPTGGFFMPRKRKTRHI